MVCNPVPKVIVANFEQVEKALFWIDVTESGIVMVGSLEQAPNAPSGIIDNEFGSVIDIKPEQP